MIIQINRTRIFEWIIELKPFQGYKDYTWELLSKKEEVDYFNNSSSMVYSFLFYDRDGEPYAIKSIGTKVNEEIHINLLARAIIDFEGGHYILQE